VRQVLEEALDGRPAAPRAAAAPLSEEELLGVLNERARNGHVSAARVLLARMEQPSKQAI
jgi:hypothetical protein